MTTITYVVLAAALLAGCKDKPETTAAAQPGAAPPVSAAPTVSSAAVVPSVASTYTGDPNDIAGLFAKLESEKANRPPGADPSVEKVFDTITTKLGIALDDRKQVAGFTIGARYCFKGVTKTDIHVVACEYMDAPSAVKGVEMASVTNKYLKHREVLQRRATTLAVQPTTESAASAADAKKIKDAFLAL